MKLDDVRILTETTLSALLGAHGFDHVHVVAGQDGDDEDALFITAKYKAGSSLPSGSELNRTLAALRSELQKSGEDRFPYLTHRLEGEETQYDAEDAPE